MLRWIVSYISNSGQDKSDEKKMGRKKLWYENVQARFPQGTLARIKRVLAIKEDRTDFIRIAVERELKRREKRKL